MKRVLAFFIFSQLCFFNLKAQTISTFPHNESFESSSGSWTPTTDNYSTACTADPDIWIRRSGATGSGGTGPALAQSGSFYIYTEASGNCSNDLYSVESSNYDFNGKNSADLSFYYHMNGTNMGTLELKISTNGGSSWTNLWSLSGSQGDAWNLVTINLNSYVNQTIKLKFDGTTGISWSSDMAVDNITVNASGGGASMPDLVVQSPSAPSTIVAGGSALVSCVVRNVGNANAAASTLRYYLSTNNTYDAGDAYLGQDAVGTLVPNGANSENTTIAIPSSTTSGTYYILFRADYNNAVSESNENNNVSNDQFNVTATCSDGIQNQGETGTDCGGPCSPCGGGSSLWTASGSNIYYNSGNVSIGTNVFPAGHKLTVDGKIAAREIKVTEVSNWADFVFDTDYKLRSLSDLELYISKNKHLPEVPSADKIIKEGYHVGNMDALLLQKIEELTLYIIELEKRIQVEESK